MFQRSRKWLLTRVLIDAALINLAVAIAYYLRYELGLIPPGSEGAFDHPYTAYLPLSVAMTILTIAILRMEGFYPLTRGQTLPEEFYQIVNATTTTTLITMAFTFFLRPTVYARSVYVYAALLMILLLTAARILQREITARLRKRGIGADHVLIVGAGEVGRALMRNIVARADLAYHVEGFVDDDPERGTTDLGRFKALGSTDNLPRLLRELPVDEVIIALPWLAREKIISILNLCQLAGITAKIVPDMFQLSLSHIAIDDVGGIPLISVRETRMSLLDAIVKRFIDLAGTLVLGIVFAPVMIVAAILIPLDSPGPIIFSQPRIGKGGRKFVAHKFRSMFEGADEEQEKLNGLNEAIGPLFKIRNDPRRTRVGRWLRKTSLDELPQLWNVIKGEMSLVGPRPATPEEVEQYQEWHKRRLDVAPGITGLSQVSGRSDLTFDEQAMLDIYYIENWSAWMDIWILLRTIPAVLFARGAY